MIAVNAAREEAEQRNFQQGDGRNRSDLAKCHITRIFETQTFVCHCFPVAAVVHGSCTLFSAQQTGKRATRPPVGRPSRKPFLAKRLISHAGRIQTVL